MCCQYNCCWTLQKYGFLCLNFFFFLGYNLSCYITKWVFSYKMLVYWWVNLFECLLLLCQIATAFRMTQVNERDCLAVAYDVAASMTKEAVDGKFIMSELKRCPNASKSRLHFLSPDSPTDSFRVSRGIWFFYISFDKQMCHALLPPQ